MNKTDVLKIEKMIYVIRGQKVMLDSDLAELYGVTTGRLNEQVKRNQDRFPDDFMFRLTEDELDSLRSQFAISKEGKGGRRYQPYVFTENGVAMLSGVLNSPRAIQVNIAIMRTFTKMRSFLAFESVITSRMSKLEEGSNRMFKIVFERLDSIEEHVTPVLPSKRKKIGLK